MFRILHVTTTGTSLVRNASSFCRSLPDLSEYCSLLDSWFKATPDSSEDIEAARNAIPGSRVFNVLLGVLASDPRRFSAELNAFFGYLNKLSSGVYRHSIVLFTTDTGVGWFCTRVLEEFLKTLKEVPDVYTTSGKHYIDSVESIRVEMFGRDFSKGSLNLLVNVKKTVKKYWGQVDEVVFNLTGGFKPETGFLLLAAGLLGVSRVYYIHEYMREVVEIPVFPLTIGEPIKSVLEKSICGKLTPLDYKVLIEYKILRPGEKEPVWLRKIAEILLT